MAVTGSVGVMPNRRMVINQALAAASALATIRPIASSHCDEDERGQVGRITRAVVP
jgi:hypothetical protein